MVAQTPTEERIVAKDPVPFQRRRLVVTCQAAASCGAAGPLRAGPRRRPRVLPAFCPRSAVKLTGPAPGPTRVGAVAVVDGRMRTVVAVVRTQRVHFCVGTAVKLRVVE